MLECALDPVAQLDRANGFEPLGWGFKSLRGRHYISSVTPHEQQLFRLSHLEQSRPPMLYRKAAEESGSAGIDAESTSLVYALNDRVAAG